MKPLLSLSELGQSVWLDEIHRGMFKSGQLRRWIDEDGLRGMTSNPAIFEKAFTSDPEYDQAIDEALSGRDWDAKDLYEHLAIEDVRSAADIFRPVYEKTSRADGYVSLEVSPYLARDTRATIEEARRLWATVNRDNVLIKVPATREGLPAIRQLLSEGINVNITLLFSRRVYAEVIEAFLSGLENCSKDPGKVASVASFFVSRIDTLVDQLLEDQCKSSCEPEKQKMLRSLQGKIAIANAKLAYGKYLEVFSSERWRRLASRGVRPQRLLWASTSTKNPRYSDVLYVEKLIGPNTVNTMPVKTMDAFGDHGHARLTLTEGLDQARQDLELLERLNISLEQVTDLLTEQAIRLFSDPFDKLLASLERKRREKLGVRLNGFALEIPSDMDLIIQDHLQQASASALVRRLWDRDASLWTNRGESRWMGWLDVGAREQAALKELADFASGVRSEGYRHVLLIGMGGSSLAPELFSGFFGPARGYPELRVLDSTDPAEIKAAEDAIDLSKTLFVISSKSGGTLEPNLLFEYFQGRVTARDPGMDHAALGRRFVAITDPGSPLDRLAASLGFRKVFYGDPEIGGRYSALSKFGLLPAALMGVDVSRVLERARLMITSCSRWVPALENRGAQLGIALGVLANHGRNKVTLVSSTELRELQRWLEQLLAESTGKNGKGLIPVSEEPLAVPEAYGNDRVFVHLALANPAEPDRDRERKLEEDLMALKHSGQPVFRIRIGDRINLGQEFFRWEFATAVAGSVIGVDPYDQPDVETSKEATRRLMDRYEARAGTPGRREMAGGRFEIPGERLIYESRSPGEIRAFASERMLPRFAGKVGLEGIAHALLESFEPSDYFAILAYLPRRPVVERELSRLRLMVRNHCRVATLVQFGPRYLHSTGQIFKGGPNSGVFLQLIGDDAIDLAVPTKHYGFGAVKSAQAEGDLQVLDGRGRRVLKLRLGVDLEDAFVQLHSAFRHALHLIRPLNNQVNTEGLNRELARIRRERRAV